MSVMGTGIYTADIQGVSWIQGAKTWISPVVSSWIMENFPDVLPNHGWYHLGKISQGELEDGYYCSCGRQLPGSLLRHVAEIVSERIAAEDNRDRWISFGANKITWTNTATGAIGEFSVPDGGAWLRRVSWE